MFLTPKQTLSEKIFLLLGKHPRSTATFIWHSVGVANYSLQAVYKELRIMQKFGLVVKVGHAFSLRISYLLSFSETLGEFGDRYLHSDLSPDILSGKNRKVWKFNSLIKLVNFWDYLLIGLVAASKTKELFGFSKHPWYHLAQTDAESRYLEAVRKVGGHIYLALGSRTPLDVWAEKFWPKDIVDFGYTKTYFGMEKDLEFDVIDDYIITVKKDSGTLRAIDDLYSRAPSKVSAEVFLRPAAIKVVLENNPKKAESIKRRFARFFGLRRPI